MNRQDIEHRDQELIKKFRTIIHNKEEQPVPDINPRVVPPGLIILFTALILSGILLLNRQPASFFSRTHESSSRPAPEPEKEPVSATDTNLGKKALPHPPLETKIPAKKSTAVNTVSKLLEPVVDNPTRERNHTLQSQDQIIQDNRVSEIQIEAVMPCSSVIDRQCILPKTTFSLARDTAATVWMAVISEKPLFSLTHVFYLNGHMYCQVPLAIRHHRMRTWSSITLRSLAQTGTWRVDVVNDKGDILGRTEFTVVE